jgi:hypothetical protein
MVPTSLSAVVAFLIFVAPGIPWAERVQSQQSWRTTDSAFREVGRGVLWSIWFSLPATAITIGLLAAVSQTWLKDENRWFVSGHPPNGTTLVVATVAGLVELSIALTIMRVTWRLLSTPVYGGKVASRESAWTTLLTPQAEGGHVSARVSLTDGSAWIGAVRGFSNDNAWGDREIILLNPCQVTRLGVVGPINPGHLVIPSAVIEAVHAFQEPPPQASPPPRLSLLRRFKPAWRLLRGKDPLPG